MAEFPALPFWTDSYLADTRHLNTEQHGAYLLLLMEAWRRPSCSLPADDEVLARLAGLSLDRWGQIREVIMAFWKYDGRRKEWHQLRLDDERAFVTKKRGSQRDKARRRWDRTTKVDATAMPEGMPDACPDDAPTPTPLSDTNVSGAEGAPFDFKKAVFDEGTALIMERMGKARGVAANIIGKWRKETNDADAKILEKIRAARAQGVADPVAWITAALKTQTEYDFIWKRGA